MKYKYPKKHTLFHEIEDLSKIKEWTKCQVGIYLTESEEIYWGWGGQKVMRSLFVISTKQSEFVYRLLFPNHSMCKNNPWG